MIAAALSEEYREKWVAALDRQAKAQLQLTNAQHAIVNAANAIAALRAEIDTTFDCAGAEIDAQTGTIIPAMSP